jgi:hypothetical protein
MDIWLMCKELLCKDSGMTASLINYCSNTSANHCEVSIDILIYIMPSINAAHL